MTQIRKHFTITGRVQGVGFRYFVQQIAKSLNLTGFVRNQYDGSVYCEAQGQAEALIQLGHRLKQGNGISHVQNVQGGDMPVLTQERNFRITH